MRLEKIVDPEPRKHYPVCTGGKRACPPEDCGGPWSYQELLHLASSPFRDYERRQARQILGRGFDPETFERHRMGYE